MKTYTLTYESIINLCKEQLKSVLDKNRLALILDLDVLYEMAHIHNIQVLYMQFNLCGLKISDRLRIYFYVFIDEDDVISFENNDGPIWYLDVDAKYSYYNFDDAVKMVWENFFKE